MISDPLILSVIIIVVMFAFLLSSIWIGVSLILTGILDGLKKLKKPMSKILFVYNAKSDILNSAFDFSAYFILKKENRGL